MNTPPASMIIYRTYLVRCWCVQSDLATPQLRFSLVSTRTGMRRSFDDFEALVAFLRQQIYTSPPDCNEATDAPESG